MKIFFLFFLVVFFCECKNVSKWPIDAYPLIKADTGFCGIWKMSEDTDKANFFLIQNSFDLYHKDLKNKNGYLYVSYFNRHGKNPIYHAFAIFASTINSNLFFNLAYSNTNIEGYILVRLLKVDNLYKNITICVVGDTTLKELNNTYAVKNRVLKNIERPSFYEDTMHFYRVNNFHSNLPDAIKYAN